MDAYLEECYVIYFHTSPCQIVERAGDHGNKMRHTLWHTMKHQSNTEPEPREVDEDPKNYLKVRD